MLELLIAGSILLVVLGSLGALFVSSSRAYETNRGATSSTGQLRSAIQALQYDVSLAGFCGLTSGCTMTDPLRLQVESRGEAREVRVIEVSYIETRFQESDGRVDVRYVVEDGQLRRAVGPDPAGAIADGISWIELDGYIDSEQTGGPPSHSRPPTGRLSGVALTIHYVRNGSEASEAFTVALQNAL